MNTGVSSALKTLFELETLHHQTNYLQESYNQIKNFNSSTQRNEKIKDQIIRKRNYRDELGLSLEDVFLIYCYTSSIGNEAIPRWINLSIRNNAISPFDELLIAELNLSLNKIPSYNNRVVYRMCTNTYSGDIQDQINLFIQNIGNVFIVNHFLSTSKVNWKNEKIIWRIETHNTRSNARYIEMMSAKGFNNEEEVLFNKESKFRIVSVESIEDFFLIYLNEVSCEVEPTLTYKYLLHPNIAF